MGKERKRYKIKGGERIRLKKRVKEEQKWKEDIVKEKKSYESKISYLSFIKWLLQNTDAIIATKTSLLKLQLG